MTHAELQQAFDNCETVQATVWVINERGNFVTGTIVVGGSKDNGNTMIVTDDGENWYAPLEMQIV